MKPSLQPGLTLTRRITVDRPRTIGFMGDEGRVYATPAMVMDVEMTCRELLLAHLDTGQDSVGTRVEIDHLAATPLDAWVEIAATLTAVVRRRITFEFSVRDGLDEVGRGRHMRFVVYTATSRERVAAKRAKLQPSG
jgi:predicted thioesterase